MSAARGEAAAYYRRGLAPIPTKPGTKEPDLLELAPYLERRATGEELKAWTWRGVGIVTGPVSDVIVLDVDGPEGRAELKKYGHPPTPMVSTPSGGLHLYFRHPDLEVKTGIRVAPGLDVKAAGGYVVAPPTVGANDQPYEWIVSPDEDEFAKCPPWLLHLLDRRQRNGAAPPVGEKIPSGQRNKQLTSIAGTMRRRGMGEAEILAALQVANKGRCEPALETAEVEGIARSVARYEPSIEYTGGDVVQIAFNGRDGQAGQPSFNLTDLGNAGRLVHRHGRDLRYCYAWEKWLVWEGRLWKVDDTGEVERKAKETVRAIYAEAAHAEGADTRKALANHAKSSEARNRIEAMISLARSEPGIAVTPEVLDADPWALNVFNGTVDLRSGELREHRREDLMTKIAPVEYHPDATASAWKAFLERVLPSEELCAFVQRASGYSATGDTSEQCLFINHGTGANGKSTYQEAISAALGDYAMRAPTEMLLAKRSGGVPNDVARLKGARCVSASETEEGRRLAESLVKDLTGQDTITARFMRAEFFDFKPTHKLWLSTNHKPEIRGTDTAIWRRIRLVPWSVTIPPTEQNKELPATLRHELPGILAWIVRGCLEWQRRGLQAPDEVRKATGAYRAEMDVLAGFVAECCEVSEHQRAYARELYAAYKRWSDETGERIESQKKFGGRLKERGFLNDRDSKTGRSMWSGLALNAEWTLRTEGSLNLSDAGFAGKTEPSEPSEPKTSITARKL